jgi:hypothetical protein
LVDSVSIEQNSCHIDKALQKQGLVDLPKFWLHYGGALKMDRAPFWPGRTQT